jgi:hypothetical protein
MSLNLMRVTLERSVYGANAVAVPPVKHGVRTPQTLITIVPHCSEETLMPIIQGRILTGPTIHTDDLQSLMVVLRKTLCCA